MRFSKIFLILLLSSVSYSTIKAQDNLYKIYSVKLKKEIRVEEIPSLLKGIDIIFWGEEHNDSIGHSLELKTFQLLNSASNHYDLGMEMFETDVQEVLNEYLNDLIRSDYIVSAGRAWPNYSEDYKPLIEFAKKEKIAVLASNAPKRYISAVTKNGLSFLDRFDPLAKTYFAPLPIHVDTGAYMRKFENIMGGHEALAGSYIFESQNLWDATMAWSIASHLQKNKNSKIFHINGGFHSDDKLGIISQLPIYLKQLKLQKSVENISCVADSSWENPQWEEYKDRGDIIILTKPKHIQ